MSIFSLKPEKENKRKNEKKNHPEKNYHIIAAPSPVNEKENCLKKLLYFFEKNPHALLNPKAEKTSYICPQNFLTSRDDYLSSCKIKKILTLQNDC